MISICKKFESNNNLQIVASCDKGEVTITLWVDHWFGNGR